LIIYYFLLGIEWLVEKSLVKVSRLRWVPFIVGGVAFAIFFLHLGRDVQEMLNPVRDRIPNVALGASWIPKNTPGDALVMAQAPCVTYLYSNRHVVPFPDAAYEVYKPYLDLKAVGARARFYEAIEVSGVSYVLVEPELAPGIPFKWSSYIRDDIIPLLEGDNKRFNLVYSDESSLIRVYRVCQ
jgi:hypothetical protein